MILKTLETTSVDQCLKGSILNIRTCMDIGNDFEVCLDLKVRRECGVMEERI